MRLIFRKNDLVTGFGFFIGSDQFVKFSFSVLLYNYNVGFEIQRWVPK